MNCPSHNDELLLLAFRYVSGELSAPETESFEAQLAEDAATQQALADVVQLSEAVAIGAAERAVTRRQERVRRRTSRRQVIAAALSGAVIAGAVFVLAGRISQHGASRDAGATAARPVSPQEAQSMVSLWSELGGEPVAASNGDESYAQLVDDANAAIGDEIPDWMLAAVAGVDGEDLSDPDGVPRPMTLPDDGDEETL
jgi:anti-sigma factor RsiW